MSFGQAFGAFGQGLSSGYNTVEKIKLKKAGKTEDDDAYTSGIEQLAQRIGLGKDEQPATAQKSEQVGAIEEVTDEASGRTWDLINRMSEGDYSLSLEASQSSNSGSGSQLDPSMIQKFMPSSSGGASSFGSLGLGGGGGGLGGSGLMGSSSGAISAGTNGGASFGLGGNLVGGSGTVGGSTFAGGGGAAAGGSSAGGAVASAGPWAALAAIIGFNEENARKKGYRDEDTGKRVQDMITGKVLTQDIEGRYEPKLDKMTGGKASGWGLTGDMKGASQIGSFRFGKGLKTLWNDGTIGKIRKIF